MIFGAGSGVHRVILKNVILRTTKINSAIVEDTDLQNAAQVIKKISNETETPKLISLCTAPTRQVGRVKANQNHPRNNLIKRWKIEDPEVLGPSRLND